MILIEAKIDASFGVGRVAKRLHSSARLLISFAVLSLVGAMLAPMRVAAQEQSLLINASFADKEFVSRYERIELVLSRPLRSEERVAVFIGTTDVTSLLTQDGLRLRYNAKLWPLPVGESPVIVYLVPKDDEWKEIVRF